MKRILSVILAASMLIVSATAAPVLEAANKSEWESFTLSENCMVTDEGVISLGFTANNDSGNAIADKEFVFDDDIFVMSVDFEISGTNEKNQRKITLKDRSASTLTCDLINVYGNKIGVFGKITDIGIAEENKTYTVTVAANCTGDTKYGAAWLDGELIWSDTLGSKWKNFNYENLKLEIRNYTFGNKGEITTDFRVSSLVINDAGESYSFSVTDGDRFVNPDMTGINVTFDGLMGGVMYEENGYVLYENGEITEFSVIRDGVNAIIVPENPFLSGCDYVLEIPEISDVFGNVIKENEQISFRTVPDGYVFPEISISVSETEVFEGENITVTADAGSSAVKNLYFTVDGEVVKTAEAGDEYSYSFTMPAGTYKIGAYVEDSEGCRGEAEEIQVTFVKNELPVISVTGLKDGESYAKGELDNTVFNVTDTDGEIKNVVISVNGTEKSFATPPYSLDASLLSGGSNEIIITAEDNAGGITCMVYNVLILGELTYSEFFSDNMDKDDSFYAMQTQGTEANFTRIPDFDDVHGTVGCLNSNGADQGAYLNLAGINNLGGRFYIEFDFYADIPSGIIEILQRQTSKANTGADVKFAADRIILSSNGVTYKNVSYSQKKWYHLKYLVEFSSVTYSVWITDDSGEETCYADNVPMHNKTIEGPSNFRFVMYPENPESHVKLYMDNMKITVINETPVISYISYDGKEETDKISPDAQSVDVVLTAPIDKNSLNKKNVKLLIGEKELEIKEVSYNAQRISIIPKAPFLSQQKYKIEISGLAGTSGDILSESLLGEFETDFAETDLSNLSVEKSGDEYYIKGTLIDSKYRDLYVIVTVWEESKMKAVAAKKITVTGTVPFESGKFKKTQGQTISVSVWDNLYRPTVLASADIK